MRQNIKTQSDKRRFRAKLFRILRVCAIVSVVLVITLISVFVPFYRLLPATAIERRQEGELRVHFLDAGQGDCSIVEFPDGALLVIDGGSGDFLYTNRILKYIKGLDHTSVSYVITHADEDHFGGIARIISCYGADMVYLPVMESEGSSYQKLKRIVTEEANQVTVLSRYDVITNPSGAYLVCISPYSSGEEDANDSSAVLFLSYMGVRILFGGDISATRERRLMRDYALSEDIFDSGEYRVRLEETDILKVSHHGSAYSSCGEWLSLLSPESAVITCGRGNANSHPASEAVERLTDFGTEVYRTDELGAVVFGITGAGYAVNTRKMN